MSEKTWQPISLCVGGILLAWVIVSCCMCGFGVNFCVVSPRVLSVVGILVCPASSGVILLSAVCLGRWRGPQFIEQRERSDESQRAT